MFSMPDMDVFNTSLLAHTISAEHPGLCIILNKNANYKNDSNKIESTFKEINFNCHFVQHNNSSNQGLKEAFLQVPISKISNGSYSCLAFFIIDSTNLFKIPSELIEIESAIHNFITRTPEFQKIPKLFFIEVTQFSTNIEESINDSLLLKKQLLPLVTNLKTKIINETDGSSELELFIFYSAYFGQASHGSLFIDELCQVLQTYSYESDNYDLHKMATKVIKRVKEKIRLGQQNPVFYTTLSRRVLFKMQNELPFNPERGRCIILNLDLNLDVSYIKSFYDNMNFVCKIYDSLNYKFTEKIINRESKNSTENCKCLVILINARCLPGQSRPDQKFLTAEDIHLRIEGVFQIFTEANDSSEKIRSCPKYIFINSNSSTTSKVQCPYYCQQKGNIFLSFNPNPVNISIQTINNYHYPCASLLDYHTLLTNMSKFMIANGDADLSQKQFKCMLIDHCTNTLPANNLQSVDQSGQKEKLFKIFKNMLYSNNGFLRVVLLSVDEYDSNLTKKLENTLQFKIEVLSLHKTKIYTILNQLEIILKTEKKIADTSCFILFVTGLYKNNEIILSQGETIKIDELLKYFKNDTASNYLTNKPKLIFIQNTGSEHVDVNVSLQKEFLLLVSSGNKEPIFNTLCKILLLNNATVQCDLVSYLNLWSVMNEKMLSMKSTLSKFLFFNKTPFIEDEFKRAIDNKSDAMFYPRPYGKRKCLILTYESKDINSNECSNLKNKFESLYFETILQTFNKNSLVDMIKSDLLRNFSDVDSFFAILILASTSNLATVNSFVEHLISIPYLTGKPKIVFILGQTTFKLYVPKIQNSTENYVKERVYYPLHADLLVFYSEYVSQAIDSICETFIDEKVKQFDLIKLLLMVSEKIGDAVNKTPDSLKISDLSHIIFPELENKDLGQINYFVPEQKLSKFKLTENISSQSQIVDDFNKNANKAHEKNKIESVKQQQNHYHYACMNSTLTRLVSLNKDGQQELTNQTYKPMSLSNQKKGRCAIFNYEKYDNDPEGEHTRVGTAIDYKKVEEIFENKSFVMDKFNSDMTIKETEEKLKQIDCTDNDCLVICFFTHGTASNDLQCSDKPIRLNDIIDIIIENEKIKNVPKFFIFQACRGDKHEPENPNYRHKNDIFIQPNSPLNKYPNTFSFFPTFEGYISWREEDTGTWFIQTLCQVLEDTKDKGYDVFDIAVIVTRIVSQKQAFEDETDENGELINRILIKQCPTFYSTLKRSYLL